MYHEHQFAIAHYSLKTPGQEEGGELASSVSTEVT